MVVLLDGVGACSACLGFGVGGFWVKVKRVGVLGAWFECLELRRCCCCLVEGFSCSGVRV